MKYFYFALVALFWGGSFIAIKEIVAVAPPIMAATLRLGAALIFLAIYYTIKKKSFFVPRRMLWKVWLTGLFVLGLPFSLLFWGEQKISPGLAGILNGCMPAFTFILSLLFLRQTEKVSKTKFAGLMVAICGMMLIFYPKLQMTGGHQELLGTVAVFFMAVSYAIGTVLARRNFSGPDKIDSYSGLFQQMVASFVYLAILSFLFEDWATHLFIFTNPTVILGTLYLGWVSTAIAFMIYYYLMEEWGVIRVSAVTYLVPMAALLFDFIFNHRVPTTSELSGAFVILAGIGLIRS